MYLPRFFHWVVFALAVTACGMVNRAWSQDPCSIHIDSLSPSTVYPYSAQMVNGSGQFTLGVTGSGFLWDQGYNICIQSADSSQGITYDSLTGQTTNTNANVIMDMNRSSGGCPPSCTNFGTENFDLVDIDGVKSNVLTFMMDYPGWMVVVSDQISVPSAQQPNVVRTVVYKVYNTGGTIAPEVRLTEDFVLSNWNCQQTIHLNNTSCNQNQPIYTDDNGQFTDQWGITSSTYVTPAGCGGDVDDQWQACTEWQGVGQQLPDTTFARPTGYIHDNEIDIEGYVTPPQSNHMPNGLRINP